MKSSDRKMARSSLREEKTAIKAYKKRAPKAKSPALRGAIKEALEDEREHAALFRRHTGRKKK